MKYAYEDYVEREEREDLIREINGMLKKLDLKQLRRVAWYIIDKWGTRG